MRLWTLKANYTGFTRAFMGPFILWEVPRGAERAWPEGEFKFDLCSGSLADQRAKLLESEIVLSGLPFEQKAASHKLIPPASCSGFRLVLTSFE